MVPFLSSAFTHSTKAKVPSVSGRCFAIHSPRWGIFCFLVCRLLAYDWPRSLSHLKPHQPTPEDHNGANHWLNPLVASLALEPELGIRFPLLPSHAAAAGSPREIELGIVFQKVFSACRTIAIRQILFCLAVVLFFLLVGIGQAVIRKKALMRGEN